MDDLREWCIGAASVEIECELRTLSEAQGTKAAAAAFDVIAPKVREAQANEITALRAENERLQRHISANQKMWDADHAIAQQTLAENERLP